MNGIIKTIEWNKVCRLCLTALSRCDALSKSSMNNTQSDLDLNLDHDHQHRLQHHVHNIFADEDYLNESFEPHGPSPSSPDSANASPHNNCHYQQLNDDDNNNDGNNGNDDNCRLNCDTICECCDSSGSYSGSGSASVVSCNRIKCSNSSTTPSPTISNVPFYPTLLLSKRPKSCRSYRFLRPQQCLPSPGDHDQLLPIETVASPSPSQKEGKLPRHQQQSAPDADCDDSPHITVQMLQCLSIEVSKTTFLFSFTVYLSLLLHIYKKQKQIQIEIFYRLILNYQLFTSRVIKYY